MSSPIPYARCRFLPRPVNLNLVEYLFASLHKQAQGRQEKCPMSSRILGKDSWHWVPAEAFLSCTQNSLHEETQHNPQWILTIYCCHCMIWYTLLLALLVNLSILFDWSSDLCSTFFHVRFLISQAEVNLGWSFEVCMVDQLMITFWPNWWSFWRSLVRLQLAF